MQMKIEPATSRKGLRRSDGTDHETRLNTPPTESNFQLSPFALINESSARIGGSLMFCLAA